MPRYAMSDVRTTIEHIDDLIRRLAAADTGFRVFGSDMHRYALGPCLSESALASFESANGIHLPADYREFLRRVGNGGAGPYYGIKTLDSGDRDLARPFPFASTSGRAPPFERPDDEAGTLVTGALELGHQGCTYYTFLVVTGPGYGTIWDADDDVAFAPTGLSFAAWYRSWAEKALRTLANERFVARLRVGMSRADVVGAAGGDWRSRPALGRDVQYLEATEIPVQLEIDPNGVVAKVTPWSFITARPT